MLSRTRPGQDTLYIVHIACLPLAGTLKGPWEMNTIAGLKEGVWI